MNLYSVALTLELVLKYKKFEYNDKLLSFCVKHSKIFNKDKLLYNFILKVKTFYIIFTLHDFVIF